MVASAFDPSGFIAFGDSKTDITRGDPNNNTWPGTLRSALAARNPMNTGWTMYVKGIEGSKLSGWADTGGINSEISLVTPNFNPRDVLINLGINDIATGLESKPVFEADYATVVEAIHSKWPKVHIWIMYPWGRGFDTDAATVHGYIDDVIAAHSAYVFAGPDEAVWFKGSDDGATNSYDGIHYVAPVGMTAAQTAWMSVLPY